MVAAPMCKAGSSADDFAVAILAAVQHRAGALQVRCEVH